MLTGIVCNRGKFAGSTVVTVCCVVTGASSRPWVGLERIMDAVTMISAVETSDGIGIVIAPGRLVDVGVGQNLSCRRGRRWMP